MVFGAVSGGGGFDDPRNGAAGIGAEGDARLDGDGTQKWQEGFFLAVDVCGVCVGVLMDTKGAQDFGDAAA